MCLSDLVSGAAVSVSGVCSVFVKKGKCEATEVSQTPTLLLLSTPARLESYCRDVASSSRVLRYKLVSSLTVRRCMPQS